MPPKKQKLGDDVSQQVEPVNTNSAEQIKSFVREVETRKKIGAYVPVGLRKLDEFWNVQAKVVMMSLIRVGLCFLLFMTGKAF
jgi:hypothetical protein